MFTKAPRGRHGAVSLAVGGPVDDRAHPLVRGRNQVRVHPERERRIAVAEVDRQRPDIPPSYCSVDAKWRRSCVIAVLPLDSDPGLAHRPGASACGISRSLPPSVLLCSPLVCSLAA
jgi:hypothetical protein